VLFTILRTCSDSDYRKRRREVEDADGNYARDDENPAGQNAISSRGIRAALEKLPQDQPTP